jgi:hypothetical protein
VPFTRATIAPRPGWPPRSRAGRPARRFARSAPGGAPSGPLTPSSYCSPASSGRPSPLVPGALVHRGARHRGAYAWNVHVRPGLRQ